MSLPRKIEEIRVLLESDKYAYSKWYLYFNPDDLTWSLMQKERWGGKAKKTLKHSDLFAEDPSMYKYYNETAWKATAKAAAEELLISIKSSERVKDVERTNTPTTWLIQIEAK